MSEFRRRKWQDSDTRALIDMWPRVGSIVLIALELKRSTSSVQTQASRTGLPRRMENNERHRRKWEAQDIVALRDALKENTSADGEVLICEIAEQVKRSIDAVAAKLAENDFFGDEERLFEKIKVTKTSIASATTTAAAAAAATMSCDEVKPSDRRQQAMDRKCMKCKKSFWSEWAGNRRCNACKKTETSDAYEY
jgi:hypothetical protein